MLPYSAAATLQKPYSEATGRSINDEVRELIQTGYEQAKSSLVTRKKEMKELASLL